MDIYRILGKFVMFFVIIPKIVNIYKQILRPALVSGLMKAINEDEKQNVKDLAKSRMNHPAGSKLDD